MHICQTSSVCEGQERNIVDPRLRFVLYKVCVTSTMNLSSLRRLALIYVSLICASSLGQAQQAPASNPLPPPPSEKALFNRAAEMYEAKNYRTALRAFLDAANGGNVDAMVYLGVMYSAGEGTPVHYEDAFTWFRKAAMGN